MGSPDLCIKVNRSMNSKVHTHHPQEHQSFFYPSIRFFLSYSNYAITVLLSPTAPTIDKVARPRFSVVNLASKKAISLAQNP